MTLLLDGGTKGVYTDANGSKWTYYRGFDFKAGKLTNSFSIVPIPEFASDANGPKLHLTEYRQRSETTGQMVTTGRCLITTRLVVPQPVINAVRTELSNTVRNPQYQLMEFVNVATPTEEKPWRNLAFLSFASADGMVSRSVSTVPSLSGQQDAIFDVADMDQFEVQFFKDYFGGNAQAGTVTVSYQMVIWVHLEGVKAIVSFNSEAAYRRQEEYKWVSS